MSPRSFIAGAHSLNEQDLHENLAYFQVPQAGIESIRSKLAFKIFDEYANILKGMCSTRFNGRPNDKWCGDIELCTYLADAAGPVPLVLDPCSSAGPVGGVPLTLFLMGI